MNRIDLTDMVGGARILIGHEKGLAMRAALKLDKLDSDRESVILALPASLRTLTPSFVQGLFAGSVNGLGERGFFDHYQFEAGAELVGDIRAGVDRVLTSRHLSGVD